MDQHNRQDRANETGPRTKEPSQKRAMHTHAELLRTAEVLVANEGCDAVTTTRIAAETGLSVGTIYRYFANREALLLATYDATVERIVEACAAHIGTLDGDLVADEVIVATIDAYLAAAQAIPAHSPLLREMQRLRPIADDHAQNHDRIAAEIFLPLLGRFGLAGVSADPGRLAAIQSIISILVDLYLAMENDEARETIRAELKAHALFAFSRLLD